MHAGLRTSCDQFAGQLGVALTDALFVHGNVELTSDAGNLTQTGMTFLSGVGIDIEPILAPRTKRSSRMLCRRCLDWSEQRLHLAGAVDAAICAHSLNQGWTRRLDDISTVPITPMGACIFREKFGLGV